MNRDLEIEVRDAHDPSPGSPAVILRVLSRLPLLPREDVEALEQAIEEGKLPVRVNGIFDESR